MKKRGKIVLATVLVLVLAVAAVAGINYGPLLFMSPVETGEVARGVYAVRGSLNSAYLMEAEDGYILVDAGSSEKAVLNGLAALGIEAAEVRYLLLTHSDSDHVAAVEAFPNAALYMGRKEIPLLDGSLNRNLLGGNSLPGGVMESMNWLDDKDALELGGRTLECIGVPGHTRGSMAYLVDGEYLFTGDAFKVDKNGRMQVHPFTMNRDVAVDCINVLAAYGKRNVIYFTAHYGVYPADELDLML